MTGLFLNHKAVIDVSLRVPEDNGFRFIDIEFVIDTGYVGDLTLPTAALQVLNIPAVRATKANLADGSTIQVNVHEAEILWLGSIRIVDIFAMDDVPLLGTLLLDGCELNIRFADHEAVTIGPL